MQCPHCTFEHSRVLNTRSVRDQTRRRRECSSCKRRFTTYERVARTSLMVVKSDARREEFNPEKLLAGLQKACAKRPVPMDSLTQLVEEIETALYALGSHEVNSSVIGEIVMEQLIRLDEVAYIRFASVYLRLADLDSLSQEIHKLKEYKAREVDT